MELKIINPTEDGFIKAIEWNHEEIKKEVLEKVEHYKNLVYTDEQFKDAKADRAKLNKFIEALETKRKEIKKQCLAPYEAFEKQMKEITSIVQESVVAIGSQILEFEDKQKQEKKDEIRNFWDSCDVPDGLTFEKVFSDKWLNASTSMKSIQTAIDDAIDKFNADMETLSNLPEFGFEATEVYKSTLDVNKAINEAKRMSDIAKAKAAHEAEMKARAEEQARLAAETEAKKQAEQVVTNINDSNDIENVAPIKPVEEIPAKQWISFSALLSVEDALALKDFFNSRNIEFKAI